MHIIRRALMLAPIFFGLLLPSVLLGQQRTKQAGNPVYWKVRCGDDSMTNDQAQQRLNWAKKHNVLSRKTLINMEIEVDENGNAVRRERLQYPLFGTWDGNPKNTKLWRPQDHGWPAVVPKGIEWLAICTASCYTGEQELLTSTGYLPIEDALTLKVQNIRVLSESSTLDAPSLIDLPVEHFTASFRETDHKIVSILTESGGTLRVTPGHVVVDGNGVLRKAGNLKVGDSLVRETGEKDPIATIEVQDYFGKVYNVNPATRKRKENLVVVQGFINGADRYQNDWANTIGEEVLLDSIPEDIF